MFLWLLIFTFLNDQLNSQVGSFNYDPEIFRCKTGFCNIINCDAVRDCPEGRLMSRSSYCKCCDTCIKTLGKEEKCQIPLDGSLHDVALQKCQAGLVCTNEVCMDDIPLPGCLKLKDIRQLQTADSNGTYAEKIWIPHCETDGTFRANQQKKRKSICVDALGENIFGQSPPGLSENMTCGCSRYMIELEKKDPNSFMTKPQEHCSSTGDFARLQCIGGLCYCADTTTGEVEDRIVTMKYIDKLPCYDRETYGTSYLKPCETELQRARRVRYGFFLKGLNVFGLERFRCDPDGTYSPVQSDFEEYVCTNKDGTRIGSFHFEIDVIEALSTKMTCNCARDTKGTDSNSQYPTMRCEGWGNYKLFQCFHKNQCFCVDDDGDTISKQLSKDNANQSVCFGLLNDISRKTGNVVVTTILPSSPLPSSSVTDDATSSEYVYDEDD